MELTWNNVAPPDLLEGAKMQSASLDRARQTFNQQMSLYESIIEDQKLEQSKATIDSSLVNSEDIKDFDLAGLLIDARAEGVDTSKVYKLYNERLEDINRAASLEQQTASSNAIAAEQISFVTKQKASNDALNALASFYTNTDSNADKDFNLIMLNEANALYGSDSIAVQAFIDSAISHKENFDRALSDSTKQELETRLQQLDATYKYGSVRLFNPETNDWVVNPKTKQYITYNESDLDNRIEEVEKLETRNRLLLSTVEDDQQTLANLGLSIKKEFGVNADKVIGQIRGIANSKDTLNELRKSVQESLRSVKVSYDGGATYQRRYSEDYINKVVGTVNTIPEQVLVAALNSSATEYGISRLTNVFFYNKGDPASGLVTSSYKANLIDFQTKRILASQEYERYRNLLYKLHEHKALLNNQKENQKKEILKTTLDRAKLRLSIDNYDSYSLPETDDED